MALKVLIPCGGKGTRRYPEAINTPKILLYHEGRPILDHIVETLPADAEILLTCKSDQADKLRSASSCYVSKKISVLIEPEGRLGFGGGCAIAEGHIDAPFIVIASDGIFNIPKLMPDYTAVYTTHCKRPETKGVVTMCDESFRLLSVTEKPETPTSTRVLAGGAYIHNWELFFRCLNDMMEDNERVHGEYQLTSILQKMADTAENIYCIDISCTFLGSKTVDYGYISLCETGA